MEMKMKFDWDRELRNEQIVEMWRQGKTSSEIAKELGITRGAVMGVVNRHGERKGSMKPSASAKLAEMLNLPKKEHPPVKKARVRKPKPKKEIDLSVPPEQLEYVQKKGKNLMQLKEFDCRWVFDDRSYCAQPKMYKSYCEYHARIVYVPIVKKEKPRQSEP